MTTTLISQSSPTICRFSSPAAASSINFPPLVGMRDSECKASPPLNSKSLHAVLEKFKRIELCETNQNSRLEASKVATSHMVSRILFSSQRGIIGQWHISSNLPNDVLVRIYDSMPVHSTNGALLDLIPGGEVPLPPDLAEVPQAIETEYFFLLDLRDRLWVQATVLQSDRHKSALFPQPIANAVAALVAQASQKVADGLLHLESAFPHMWRTYRSLERDRIMSYAESHPLRLIQPYLIPTQLCLPDYTPSVYAAFARRNGIEA